MLAYLQHRTWKRYFSADCKITKTKAKIEETIPPKKQNSPKQIGQTNHPSGQTRKG